MMQLVSTDPTNFLSRLVDTFVHDRRQYAKLIVEITNRIVKITKITSLTKSYPNNFVVFL